MTTRARYEFLTIQERQWFESITSSWAIPNTHPYEPTLAHVGHHSLHSQNSWSCILTWIARSPKPIANMVLDQSPSFNTLLLEMLTVQWLISNKLFGFTVETSYPVVMWRYVQSQPKSNNEAVLNWHRRDQNTSQAWVINNNNRGSRPVANY